jgi:hypothetical protein
MGYSHEIKRCVVDRLHSLQIPRIDPRAMREEGSEYGEVVEPRGVVDSLYLLLWSVGSVTSTHTPLMI